MDMHTLLCGTATPTIVDRTNAAGVWGSLSFGLGRFPIVYPLSHGSQRQRYAGTRCTSNVSLSLQIGQRTLLVRQPCLVLPCSLRLAYCLLPTAYCLLPTSPHSPPDSTTCTFNQQYHSTYLPTYLTFTRICDCPYTTSLPFWTCRRTALPPSPPSPPFPPRGAIGFLVSAGMA